MADQYVEDHGGQVQPDAPGPATEADAAIISEIRDFLALCESYEDEQRKAEEAELLFQGEDQWGEDARAARAEKGTAGTEDYVPAKPTLTVNLTEQNIQQGLAEARQARLALTVKPKAGLGTTAIANDLKGLVKTIQSNSGALSIRLWSLERVFKVGRGGYFITAEYANDGDFDLDLVIKRILDYGTVYWDPYSTEANRKDAMGCLKLSEWMSVEARQRRWPKKPYIPPAGSGIGDAAADAFYAADETNPKLERCRVATYWKVQFTDKELVFHPSFGQKWESELSAEQTKVVQGDGAVRRRTVQERSVEIIVTDGVQVLERTPWHGRFIPVCEHIGKEYVLRGKRRYKGFVAEIQDILRAINLVLSSAVEVAGMMPRAPYIMIAGQDENFETEWDELFIANRSRVHVNAVDVDGKPAGFPQRQQTEPQVQGLLLLLRMLMEMYHNVSGSVAPQARMANPVDRSGKAIEALLRQSSAGQSGPLDNLATITMPYEGEVLIDAIPNYYDRPGRIVQVMGEEDDYEQAIMIKRPFIAGTDGMPEPVPCPTCAGKGQVSGGIRQLWAPVRCPACQGDRWATEQNMPKEWNGKSVRYVDFSKGRFTCVAALDRDFKTKQSEALAGMEALAAAVPQLVPMYADLWVKAMGFSGSREIADRIKAQNPALAESEDMGELPPAVQAKVQQLMGQHQQAMAALQEAQKMLETDAVKAAGQKEIAVIRAAVQEKLEKLKAEGRIIETHKSGQQDAAMEVLRGQIQAMQQENQHRHEILLELLKEQKEKEIERHSVQLHDHAAAEAEARLEGREARGFVRDRLATEVDEARVDRRAGEDREHQAGLTREQLASKERLSAAQAAAKKTPDQP